jgi:hypothetical protein
MAIDKRVTNQSSAVYFMGFIGSLIYFIQNSSGFVSVLLGILKSFVWPAILIYKALAFLQM